MTSHFPEQQEYPRALFPLLGRYAVNGVSYVFIGEDYDTCYQVTLGQSVTAEAHA